MNRDPRSFDDEELEEMIEHVREEVTLRYRLASEYYGIPCMAGKRRYDAYKAAAKVFEELLEERSTRS